MAYYGTALPSSLIVVNAIIDNIYRAQVASSTVRRSSYFVLTIFNLFGLCKKLFAYALGRIFLSLGSCT